MPETNDAAEQTDLDFMLPVAAGYISICLTWWVIKYRAAERWDDERAPVTNRPWLDLGLLFVGIVGVFLLGQAYRAGLRLPDFPGNWNYLATTLNLCIPFLPIFAVLAIRRQSLQTVWLSSQAIGWKLLVGLIASAIGLTVYLAISGEWNRLGEIASDSISPHSLSHAVPVFLEGLAIAFIFVRLRWLAPAGVVILVPCVLFAAAHIPRFTENDHSLVELVIFVSFNTAVAAMVFSTALRARDIIWIAAPHYVMDIAIRAFY